MPGFNWNASMKIPEGAQMPDGKPVPEGAMPQADGSVTIPGGASLKWGDITLPDGFKLTSIIDA